MPRRSLTAAHLSFFAASFQLSVLAGQLAQNALSRSLVHPPKQGGMIQIVVQHVQLLPIFKACIAHQDHIGCPRQGVMARQHVALVIHDGLPLTERRSVVSQER